MSGIGDKLEGRGNEIKGDAKQTVGQETNDPNMIAEGKMDDAKGAGQGIVGKVKGAVEDLKDKAKD
jgi:uncharacterized protein YjbJ (UPF0337 family)